MCCEIAFAWKFPTEGREIRIPFSLQLFLKKKNRNRYPVHDIIQFILKQSRFQEDPCTVNLILQDNQSRLQLIYTESFIVSLSLEFTMRHRCLCSSYILAFKKIFGRDGSNFGLAANLWACARGTHTHTQTLCSCLNPLVFALFLLFINLHCQSTQLSFGNSKTQIHSHLERIMATETKFSGVIIL